MVYRALGLMSGSSLDGLDMAFVEFHETSGKWIYSVKASACYSYPDNWVEKLKNATSLPALDYQLLHSEYGHYIGTQVNRFVEEFGLQYQVQLIASHGHTTFHIPAQRMTAQLGDGAAIAAETGINVVSDLRAMDIALGGQGAPIVPIGEKLLLGEYQLLLNLGGIANISFNNPDNYIAFDICPANRVLNMLANQLGKEYDEEGKLAASGIVDTELLEQLNALDYYGQPYPKSLANDFGTALVYPLIMKKECSIADAIRTYTGHIVFQIKKAISLGPALTPLNNRLLVTGGGAHNNFLIDLLSKSLNELNIEVVVPEKELVDYKEAIVMALIGVLRWRENNNVLASVTGAKRDSIGGAVWIGQEA